MKIVNIMNFVRQCDPRMEDSERILFETAKEQVAMVREYGIRSTFLLQYDALTDAGYQELFRREHNDKLELGLWYEIVKPLCERAGIPWRGREDWSWDWHVVPGFSMAYTPEERIRLADIAMEDFERIFGFYPATVASWLIDSHTVKHLADNYPVTAFAVCRDQTETDAYTLVGGYFNQGYYPSKNNILTPAQTESNQISVPVFRLLGPDPIHNYDNDRYLTDPAYLPYHGCYTMEPVWRAGSSPELVDWFFKSYFQAEDLGFSYAQTGQENSFGPQLLPGLRLQLETLKRYPQIQVWQMGETGVWFQRQYPEGTPATCVSALTDWDGTDRVQSVYYNCRNYTANLFRFGGKIFIRSLYLFDENVPEHYLRESCMTWDAVYENLPAVDTLLWKGSEGLILDTEGTAFSITRHREGELRAFWGDKQVLFTGEGIYLSGIQRALLDWTGSRAAVTPCSERIAYEYQGHAYSLMIQGAVTEKTNGCILTAGEDGIGLSFRRERGKS